VTDIRRPQQGQRILSKEDGSILVAFLIFCTSGRFGSVTSDENRSLRKYSITMPMKNSLQASAVKDKKMPPNHRIRIDHLVYATPDLEASVAAIEARLGIRPAPGGQHPGRGTKNALLALSNRFYLEIVGPDPAQAKPAGGRWFQIDSLNAPRLVTWAVKEAELEKRRAIAAASGIVLGPLASGSRQRADGSTLRWRFTDPAVVVADGIVPFFIDWAESPHPAATAPAGPVLESLRAAHPEPAFVMRALSAVGIDLPVASGPRPALIATLRTEKGLVELR
jgi:hypothetical protein